MWNSFALSTPLAIVARVEIGVEAKPRPKSRGIERDQGLQAENADQLCRARLGLEKLPVLRVEKQVARQRA